MKKEKEGTVGIHRVTHPSTRDIGGDPRSLHQARPITRERLRPRPQ